MLCFFFIVFLCSIEQLNISWCDFNNNHVKSVVDNLSSSVTHLNLGGYRESLTLDGKWMVFAVLFSFLVWQWLMNMNVCTELNHSHINLLLFKTLGI